MNSMSMGKRIIVAAGILLLAGALLMWWQWPTLVRVLKGGAITLGTDRPSPRFGY